MRERFLLSLALLLALGIGALIGRISRVTAIAVPPTVLQPDTRPLVPVVRVDGVENGQVHGRIQGDVRVFIGEEIVVPNAEGAYRLPAADSLRDVVIVRVPAGMRFVASRRGKKYYAIGSSAGEKIVPENRVYFRTAAEAEVAGYAH